MKNFSTKFAAFFVLAALGLPGDAWADAASDAYSVAQASYKSLQAAPEDRKQFRHTWQDAIEKFKLVAEKYPKSAVADDALFTTGKLYYELYDISRLRRDLESAVTAFKACATRFPESNYADDSLFWQAKALHLLKRHTQEVTALNTILEKYPNGDMQRDARRQLAELVTSGEAPKGSLVATTPAPTAVPVETKAVPSGTKVAAATPTATAAPVIGPTVRSGGTISEESQPVSNVKVWSNEGYTRVAIYTGGDVYWTAGDLRADGDKPPRIYIDLTKAHIGEGVKNLGAKDTLNSWQIPVGDGLLQGVRFSQNKSDTVRVVLDVGSMERYEILPQEDPVRLIIDVIGSKEAPAIALTKATPVTSATPTEAEMREQLERLKSAGGFAELGLKVGRIYIDAGHGGKDDGATGPGGLHERDVTLAIARKLSAALIEKGYDAILTRTDNTYLELEERTGIANEGKGDLFVSIHCNSHDPKSKSKILPSGVETYFAGASDAASARVAAIENKTSEKKMSELDQILQGLVRGEYTMVSAELADTVQNKLYGTVRKSNSASKNFGVKSALFYVLLTAHMPAILVETSFISNTKDEKLLADPKYQQGIADAVANGVDAYLESRAKRPSPTPTKIADPRPEPDAPEKKKKDL